MTNKKSTKKALLMSCLSLLLCCSMLIGTTFAWFTDEVKSGTNLIAAGNLDVELYHSDDNATNEKVTGATKLFDDVYPSLWEPGAVAYEILTVANEGTLALKYNLAVLAQNATNVNGYTLADALWIAVVDADALSSREAAIAAGAGKWQNLASFDLPGTLEAGKSETYGIVIYWLPTDFDNIFNMNNENQGKTLSIELGVHLTATQLTAENDSYGPDYDGDALVCDIVATPETIDEILASVEPGTVIGLASGEYGTITLTQNGLTLVSNSAVVGMLDLNEKDNIVIEGLTFDAATAQTAYNAGGAASEYVTNLTDGKAANGGSVGVVIKNCAFTGTAADAAKYIPVYFGDTGRGNRSDDIVIEGCVFQTNAQQYIALNGVTNNSGKTIGEIVIKNNVFGGNGFGTLHNTIQATGQGCNWTITGNKFYNWGVIKTAIGSSSNGSNLTWNVIGNDFCNEDGTIAMALKTSYNANNCTINFAENTVWGGNGVIVPSAVNGENETVYGGQKIQINDGVVIADSVAELKAANVKNATIVLAPGTYDDIPTFAEGTTIIGTDGVVFTDTLSGTLNNTTVKNVHIKAGNAQRWSYSKGDIVFEDCTFEATSVYAIHYDGTSGNVTYKNCKIIGWVAIAGGANHITFDGCEIYGNGSYGVIRLYSAGTIKNCTFDVANVNTTDVYQDGIHAVDCEIVVSNNINVNGAMSEIYNISGTGVITEQ